MFMRNTKRYKNSIFKSFEFKVCLGVLLFVVPFVSVAQVTATVDSTQIKIGQEITYTLEVETDTTNLVVFPEGQTFRPLEMIESYQPDTTKSEAKYRFIKKYGLTQFDSGAFTIPPQKVIVGSKTFYTDSLKVAVNNVVVDTTKQGLYDIKPLIQVDKPKNNRGLFVLGVLLALALVAFLLYWFIWRKKPLSEAEKIALLPPYDKAKLALKKLDETNYLQQAALKDYYSELTFIIRRYLDEKVYNRALESTTDELISRLHLLKDGNQVAISKDDIQKLESIFKRADLVKFAKSSPDIALAQLDREVIGTEIDQVKQALPEPSEEEKLLDEKYRDQQARKKKHRKIILTTAIAAFLLIGTFVGFGLKYGFTYVKDTIIGHDSKTLLESRWVTSDYGYPPIHIATPKVLKRMELPAPPEYKAQFETTAFGYGTLLDVFSVMVSTTLAKGTPQQAQQPQGQQQPAAGFDLLKAAESSIKAMEQQGATDIVVKSDKFTTPNGAEGLKTHGTLSIPILNTEKSVMGKYALFQFTAEQVLQQIIITWPVNDTYAEKVVDRIVNSIELKKEEK